MEEEIKNVTDAVEEAAEAVGETVEETAAEAAEEESAAEETGNVRISLEVVSTIAGIATSEIEGVAGMYGTFAGGIAEMLGAKRSPSKGVKVDMDGENVTIDLYIVAQYGVRIPELAWEIQENVKNNVETMTGLNVLKVNIHIEGVSFDKEKTDQPKEEAAETAHAETDDSDEEEITD